MSHPSEIRFFRSFATAARAYVAEESAPVRLEDGSLLYPSQALYLMTLRASPGSGLTAVAAALSVRKPSASQALARLQELGYVERKTAPGDARGALFSLTRAGARACDALGRRHDAATSRLRGVLGGYTAAELERFAELLDSLPELLGDDRRPKRGPRHG